jgi:sulfur-oxidizing protein SoxA
MIRLVLLVLALGACATASPTREIAAPRSGVTFTSDDIRQLQSDDAENPGMLWVEQGKALWSAGAGPDNKSCASCHGDAASGMRGVAARYPVYDAAAANIVNLEGRINQCRVQRQQAEALRYESEALLALTAYVAHQSRGQPIAPSDDERLAPFAAAGRDFFNKRQGQLNLSCALCHDDNWGKRLAGNIVPQGHPTGYPLYRLEWQSLGSLQRRLRNCISGMRAEVPDYGAPEYTNLDLFLMRRASGMPMESPAVRP